MLKGSKASRSEVGDDDNECGDAREGQAPPLQDMTATDAVSRDIQQSTFRRYNAHCKELCFFHYKRNIAPIIISSSLSPLSRYMR